MAKKIEVDEADYNASVAVVETVNKMLANPEARKLVLQARKKTDPNAVIPEIDARAPIDAAITDLNAKFDKFTTDFKAAQETSAADQRKSDAAQAWTSGQRLAKRSGYDGDYLKQLEDWMQERGIFEHEIAIPAYEALHPQPAPVTSGVSGSFDFFAPVEDDKDDMKKMFDSRGDDPSALNNLINKALNETRSSATAI